MAHEWRLLQDHALSDSGFSIQDWALTETGQVCLRFQQKVLTCTLNGLLIYPDFFPDVPAYIKPQRLGESWSSHQYLGSGVLCLEYGPDNWDRNITGLDLVRSAFKLVCSELISAVSPSFAAIPSRHLLTPGQEVRGEKWRFVVTPGLRSALAQISGSSVELTCAISYLGGRLVMVPTELGTPPIHVCDVPIELKDANIERSGWALTVGSVPMLGKLATTTELKEKLETAWPWPDGTGATPQVLLLHDGANNLRAFCVADGTEPSFREYYVVDFSSDTATRLPAEYEVLTQTTVGIIGLGSLGSKIAVSLARAGVKHFLLVDDDALAPQNLVRHQLSWQDVGYEKVDAVAREIKLVIPDAKVTVRAMRVAGQENPSLSSVLDESLSSCNLIIDATATPSAFVALAAVCRRAGVALVWGEVFGGGGGGLMARSRPGLDADPLSVRSHIYGALSELAPSPDYKVSSYGAEVEGHVYVASDADVSALAASMTQFTLDALSAGAESAYPVAAYLIGFRKFWVFQQPFDVIPIDCAAAMQLEQPEEPLTAQEQADLAKLTRALEVRSSASDNGSN
jgi:hypothetical protein